MVEIASNFALSNLVQPVFVAQLKLIRQVKQILELIKVLDRNLPV